MGELGFLGANIQGYDCAGVSTVAYGLITKEVERVDSGYRSGFSVQSSLAMTAIHQFGTEELKERLLPQLAKGKLVGCFGLTEPDHGSDPGSMETIAREHPTKKGYYLISGAKTWITNSPIADVLIVWARLESTGKIRGFAVERSKCPPGKLETPAIKNKTALRASITGMILLDECPVSVENMFPDVQGLKGPFTCLNSARLGISFGATGLLEDCLSRARNYALERKQFKGNPLGKYQLVQKKLADAATDAAYGTLAATQVARLKDAGKALPEMISMVKRQNVDRALENSRKYILSSFTQHFACVCANSWWLDFRRFLAVMPRVMSIIFDGTSRMRLFCRLTKARAIFIVSVWRIHIFCLSYILTVILSVDLGTRHYRNSGICLNVACIIQSGQTDDPCAYICEYNLLHLFADLRIESNLSWV